MLVSCAYLFSVYRLGLHCGFIHIPMSSKSVNGFLGESQRWFCEESWRFGWSVSRDASVDRSAFYEYYMTTGKLWDDAFQFLAHEDLGKLKVGDIPLRGDDLMVKVQEYVTREEHETRFEAHQKYADIQYVVFGRERIAVARLSQTKVLVPYDEDNDVLFLASESGQYRVADPGCFFIFFPNDAHRPCVTAGNPSRVRKIVIKVRVA